MELYVIRHGQTQTWECIDEIKEKYPDKKILIVTHNGVCRMIGAYFNGIPEDGNLSIYAHDNCEIKSYHSNNDWRA